MIKAIFTKRMLKRVLGFTVALLVCHHFFPHFTLGVVVGVVGVWVDRYTSGAHAGDTH